ncbi:MAG TPA: GNAT family N-acetyltransferase [Gaiellaceae bacterium]|nr:GNAT family N-acetyltransferase [Gaiellaceae bacterium]
MLDRAVAAVAGEPVDVILRDGGTLRLRPPRREDDEALLEFFQRLSERSLYLRFHGFPSVSPQLVEPFLEADWDERGVLLGTLAEDGEERVVALGNYTRLRDRALAEAAFTVADEHQRRGIGTRLLEQLARRAADVGIERFVAEVMADNSNMLGVFEAVGFELTRELKGGEVEVQFPITATARYDKRVEERDHAAVTTSLRPFFEPRGVAVLGASRRRGSIGGELFRNILAGDFAGVAYPVNREGEPVAGVRAYRSIAEIPEPVDVAVIALPAAGVLEAAERALEAGVRALVVISAGFAEVGSAGAERQDELLALVRAHGARLIGPNCLGIAVAGPSLNATFAASFAQAGNIAFSSQSGALGVAYLEAAEARGLGLSSFVSIGNKADVSSNDLLEWWEDDPSTSVVLLYLESFGNPRRFGQIARRVARRKPIVALKSGTTSPGQRAASSHTAALAGSDAAVDALFRQAGVIRATSLEELIDVAALLSSQPEPKGRRVAVLTNAGGLGILCADACDAAGLELPALTDETRAKLAPLLPVEASLANPIDMLGAATVGTYAEVLPLVLADPQVDALIVLFVPTVTASAAEVAAAVDRIVADAVSDKPVLAVVMAAAGIPQPLRGSGAHVAAFAYPESAARALGRAAERAEWLHRPHGTTPAVSGIDREAAESVVDAALERGEDVWLDSAAARELLLAYGLPLVEERIARDVDEAETAASELGFPVAVKTATAGAHKTELGGIALDLGDEAEVRAAVERLGSPVLVQPMVRGSAELLAGLVQDPVFGPLVAFGPGGVLAELIGEAGFRIAPMTDRDAEELVLGGKSGRLVRGFRGAPAADTASLVDLVHRLARLGEDLPAVAELDLNPVIARPDGCVVVDARVRVRHLEPVARIKTW